MLRGGRMNRVVGIGFCGVGWGEYANVIDML